jgi:hypothetical protein
MECIVFYLFRREAMADSHRSQIYVNACDRDHANSLATESGLSANYNFITSTIGTLTLLLDDITPKCSLNECPVQQMMIVEYN